MKFFFDQTAASVVNLVLFVVIINLLKGETVARSWELVVEVSSNALLRVVRCYGCVHNADFRRTFGLL
jgi:hypothetical protein